MNSVAFSADGKTLAYACDDGAIKLWVEEQGGSWRNSITLQRHSGAVYAALFLSAQTLSANLSP